MHEDRREGTIERKRKIRLVLLAIDIVTFLVLDDFKKCDDSL